MQLALDDAGLDAAAIGHVNAHGTSTPLNDAAEAEAIRKVFGDAAPPVTSTKGVTGHLIGAAGAAEAVIALLSLRDGVVPPTANLEQIGDDIGLDVVAGEPAAIERNAGAVELVRVRRPQRHADPRAAVDRRRVTRRPHARLRAPQRRGRRRRSGSSTAGTVSWFRLDGGKHRGAIGTPEGETIERAVRLAVELGIPVVGRIAQLGRRRQRGRRRAPRVGPRRQGAGRRVGRRADRARCSSGPACRAPRCCSASPTTWS